MTSKNRKASPSLKGFIEKVISSQPKDAEEETGPEGGSPESQTFLIIGLGNPGREYANNRHNIGFMFVDLLAERLGIQFSRMQFKALVADALYQRHKLILVKPQTFMNESGKAVAALQKFYKVPLENVIVGYDDMDLPIGRIRIRPKGGSGGQKGMRSIIQRLGNNQNFPRMRLGVGRPPGKMPPPAYLLQDFSKEQAEILPAYLDDAVSAVLTFVTDGIHTAMNRYNGSVLEND